MKPQVDDNSGFIRSPVPVLGEGTQGRREWRSARKAYYAIQRQNHSRFRKSTAVHLFRTTIMENTFKQTEIYSGTGLINHEGLL